MKNQSIINILFFGYVIVFFFDSIINQFIDFPLLSGYLIFQFIVLIGFFIFSRIINVTVFSVLISLIISISISLLKYNFNIKDISDFLFIANFLLFTGVLFKYHHNTSISLVNFSFLIAFVLFIPSFFGFEGSIQESTLASSSEDLEYLREYHAGFFRVPHVASYFFTFYFLTYLRYYQITRKSIYLIIGLVSLSSSFYVGSRAIIFAMLISVGIYFLKRHKIIILPILVILGIGFYAIIDKVLMLMQGTIAFQYFSFFQTLVQNTSRLSRLIIWRSWFQEIKEFDILEVLFGKSFSESMLANLINLNLEIWFHNDFLSIVFSYGIITFFLYILFFKTLYKKNKIFIADNFVPFIFFISIILSSIFNGFYYYHTVIVIYLFFFLIKISNYEDSYCWNSRHT